MFPLFLRTLRAHPWFAWLAIGMALSSIGSGLTYVVVYGELLRLHAPASSLALAFALTTLPALAGSALGERGCRRVSPATLLMLAEGIGLAGLLWTAWGLYLGSISVLQWAEAGTALAGGLTAPAFNLLIRRGLPPDRLPAATLLQNLVFAGNVLLGIGLGTLLYGRLSSSLLLAIDAGSYVLAILCFAHLGGPRQQTDQQVRDRLPWQTLSRPQQRAMLLLPALALVGAPTMALLPGLIPPDHAAADTTDFVLTLLFARSLGQLFGPLVLPVRWQERGADHPWLTLVCMAGFLACYGLLPWAGQAAPMLVLVAHLLSNVVFSIGALALLRQFDEGEIAAATATAYRWQQLVAGAAALAVGWPANHWGSWPSLAIGGVISWCAVSAGWWVSTRQTSVMKPGAAQ